MLAFLFTQFVLLCTRLRRTLPSSILNFGTLSQRAAWLSPLSPLTQLNLELFNDPNDSLSPLSLLSFSADSITSIFRFVKHF